MGGYVETGAELNGASEPVSSLCDALKPKLHYAYDWYADAYLRAYVERNPADQLPPYQPPLTRTYHGWFPGSG